MSHHQPWRETHTQECLEANFGWGAARKKGHVQTLNLSDATRTQEAQVLLAYKKKWSSKKIQKMFECHHLSTTVWLICLVKSRRLYLNTILLYMIYIYIHIVYNTTAIIIHSNDLKMPQSGISVSNRYHGIAAPTQKINGLCYPCCSPCSNVFHKQISNLFRRITTKTLEENHTPRHISHHITWPYLQQRRNGFPVFFYKSVPFCKALVRSCRSTGRRVSSTLRMKTSWTKGTEFGRSIQLAFTLQHFKEVIGKGVVQLSNYKIDHAGCWPHNITPVYKSIFGNIPLSQITLQKPGSGLGGGRGGIQVFSIFLNHNAKTLRYCQWNRRVSASCDPLCQHTDPIDQFAHWEKRSCPRPPQNPPHSWCTGGTVDEPELLYHLRCVNTQ